MFYALVLVCLSFLFKSCSFQLLFWAIVLAVLEHWWNRLPEKYITLKRNSKTIIWGMGGAGKSQLANKLGKKYNIPVLHLDDIKFGPGWRLRSKVAMRISLTRFLEENKDAWIMEGLLSGGDDACRDLLFELCQSQANHIILLQPFIWIRLFRILKRSVFRRLSLEPLGVGGSESLSSIWDMLCENMMVNRNVEAALLEKGVLMTQSLFYPWKLYIKSI